LKYFAFFLFQTFFVYFLKMTDKTNLTATAACCLSIAACRTRCPLCTQLTSRYLIFIRKIPTGWWLPGLIPVLYTGPEYVLVYPLQTVVVCTVMLAIGFMQMLCTVATCFWFLALLWFYKTRSFLSRWKGGGVYSFHIVTIYPFSAVGSDRCLNYVQVTVVRNFPMIQQSSRQKTGAQCHRQKFLACANGKHDKIFKLMSSLPKMQHRNNSVCLICYSLSKTNS
jgi:hypothetical protein